MDNAIVTKTCGLSVDAVKRASMLLRDALTDARFGELVLARMPGTFQTDFEANVTALATAVTRQSGARGTANSATTTVEDLIEACALHTRTARDLAKIAFAGQDQLLHSEFAIGERNPAGIASIVTRAEKVHAACVKYAEPLELAGWPAEATTTLLAAITALTGADGSRHTAKQAKKSATAETNRLASLVYVQCRQLQIVANALFPAAKAASDSSVVEARGTFLLGVFPTHFGAPSNSEPETPAAPTGATAAPAASNTPVS